MTDKEKNEQIKKAKAEYKRIGGFSSESNAFLEGWLAALSAPAGYGVPRVGICILERFRGSEK